MHKFEITPLFKIIFPRSEDKKGIIEIKKRKNGKRNQLF